VYRSAAGSRQGDPGEIQALACSCKADVTAAPATGLPPIPCCHGSTRLQQHRPRLVCDFARSRHHSVRLTRYHAGGRTRGCSTRRQAVPVYPPLTAFCAVSSVQEYLAGKYRVTMPENDVTAHSVPFVAAALAVILMVKVAFIGSFCE
jgi:hypothetical protein